jgi:hypothetical protein
LSLKGALIRALVNGYLQPWISMPIARSSRRCPPGRTCFLDTIRSDVHAGAGALMAGNTVALSDPSPPWHHGPSSFPPGSACCSLPIGGSGRVVAGPRVVATEFAAWWPDLHGADRAVALPGEASLWPSLKALLWCISLVT